MMYGQMTAGSVDLHRQPGHRAGHLRDLRRRPSPTSISTANRRALDSDRRASAAWAARSRWRRRWPGLDASPSSARTRIDFRLRPLFDRMRSRRSTNRWRSSKRRRTRAPISVGLLGNAADVFANSSRAASRPHVVTDQTSAHDPINGHLPPAGRWRSGMRTPRIRPARASMQPAAQSMANQVRAMLDFRRRRGDARLRQQHPPDGAGRHGRRERLRFPRLRPAYIRPLCSAKARGSPFRWVALSGDPETSYRTDAKVAR